jgi:hypothetical protein
MRDADRPRHRLARQPRHQIVELALRPPPLDPTVDQRRKPRRIITPILKPT